MSAAPQRSPQPQQAVQVRPVGQGELPDLVTLNHLIFAGHPEQGSLTKTDFAERMSEPWFDADGLLVASAGGQLLGLHWTKIEPGSDVGEVYVLGVAPRAQGTGLARRLLDAGIAHLSRRGVHHVKLFVEAGNEPAARLYQGAGFVRSRVDVQYRVDPDVQG